MRIFVYGSLRRKQGNSHWMTNAQWLGAHSVDDYQLYSLGHYPGAVPGEGTVHGEVYRALLQIVGGDKLIIPFC